MTSMWRGSGPGFGSEEPSAQARTIWTAVSIAVVVIVFAALAVVNLRPPGVITYRVQMPESGGLKTGDGVRLAGVAVGKVVSLELTPEAVDMEFTVDAAHVLGDLTAIDVRMLTPVGGLYVAVLPDGTSPLRAPIPQQRVRLPYLVSDLIPDAARVADEVDSSTLRRSLEAAADGLSGAPGATRGSIRDLEAVVTTIAEQKQQVEDLLSLSNEYLATARQNQALTTEVIRAYAILGPEIVKARSKVESFADSTTAIVGLLFDFLGGPWEDEIEPLLFPIERSSDLSRELLADTDRLIRSMRSTLEKLADLAGPEGRALVDASGLTVQRPDVCIPVPGLVC